MNILFLDQFTGLGGAQQNLLALFSRGWTSERPDYSAHAALPDDGPLARALGERGVAIHRISLGGYSLGRKNLADGIRFILDVPRVASEIAALVRELRIDLVYVNGPRLMPAVAQARLGVPVIFHAHNSVSAGNGAALVAAALRRTNAAIIAASGFVAGRWERRLSGGTPAMIGSRLPERRIAVIYGGVAGPPRPRRIRKPALSRIGLIGRIGEQKGQRELVLAARELADEWPEARFVICGDALFGDRAAQRYKRQVLALAPPSVQFTGWQDNAGEVLGGLDLLVAPFRDEGGISRVILEAFAAGVPVLASASGAIPEAVREGETGFLLHDRSPAAIAGRLRVLRSQPERLAQVAQNAWQLWRQRFTRERYCEEVWSAVETAALPSSLRNTQAAARPMTAVNDNAAG